jgi:hypothetical protein
MLIELMLNHPKVSYLPKGYYHHSYNANSITRKKDKIKYIERRKFLLALGPLFIKYNRSDLDNDSESLFSSNFKYQLLSEGLVSSKEYKDFYPVKLSSNYRKVSGFHRFFILFLAENHFFYPAKFLAGIINKMRDLIV